MAEVCAILGGVGSIFSIVNGISKVIGTISDLQTKWGEADLTLLSLASQLIALRAASTKIQEWIDQDLQDTHHQLVMDLDVSVSCCKLLMTEIESFFSDLAQLTEKPLDLRDKFKVVFGSYGPESVQKLIEHQTSSLTLLLTACNCKTLSEQQRILGTNKTRKVLDRAKADSISLYVHRDSASLTSKMTDNMSKISRVFEFDSNIFSTGVYERAFRGSVRDLLKRRQQTLRAHPIASSAVEPTPTPGSLQSICFLGPDQIGMDLLIDTIQTDQHHLHDEWALHQWQLRKLFLSLVITIVRTRSDHCDEEDAGIVMRFMRTEEYLERYSELHSVSHKALGACTRIWNDAVQLAQDPHIRNASRERVEFGKMVFWVQIIPDRGLSVTSGNYAARSQVTSNAHVQDLDSPFFSFVHRIESVLPVSSSNPFQGTARLADLLRGARMAFEDVAFQLPIGYSSSVRIVDPNTLRPGDGTAYVFFVDLHDYNLGFELEKRAAERVLASASLLTAHQQPVIGLVLRHSGRVMQQMVTSDSLAQVGRTTNAAAKAISHITMVFKSHLRMENWDFSFIFNETEDVHSAETLARLENIVSGITVRTRPFHA